MGDRVILEAIEKIEQGEERFLPIAYRAFAHEGDHLLIGRTGQAICGLLKTYSMSQMIRLSERFREYTSMEWYVDWNELDLSFQKEHFYTEEDYRYALILGSFHPNGYFREKCIWQMAKYSNTLPYLILRMNDWVGIIQKMAFLCAKERIHSCDTLELFYSMQALDKVCQSGRRGKEEINEIKRVMKEKIIENIENISLCEIVKYEFSIRKSIYKLIFSSPILKIEQADYLLRRERHSFCQSIIILGILTYYECPMKKIDQYLEHKSPYVRRRVLEYKEKILGKSWDGLERFLLDKNRGVRELASYFLRRDRGWNILEFYKEHLKDENPSVAIVGISENGKKQDASLIMPFLKHDSQRVVKYAVLALGNLMGEDAGEILWEYLLDDRIMVKKASYRAICKHSIRYGAKRLYETYYAKKDLQLQRYLVQLLLRELSWDRLPYLILLYPEQCEETIRGKILSALGKRNMYTKISQEQKQTILTALEVRGELLPRKWAEEIKYDLKFVMKE